MELDISFDEKVSIHSRTEAAAYDRLNVAPHCYCFNTQPREGGCLRYNRTQGSDIAFQHTAARRRLQTEIDSFYRQEKVSTHSRAEAAAEVCLVLLPV